MKILTWNINGIRAVQRDKTSLKKLLDSLGADVICLQETKVTRDMLDEPTAIVEGYDSYFGFSRKKTGYSGTANFCRVNCIPCKAEEGLTGRLSMQKDDTIGFSSNEHCFTSEELDALDDEGRCVITQHKLRLPSGDIKEVAIINVYVPRAGDREERLEYKLKFLTLLQLRAENLLRNGVHVIVLGDINTTHTKIDHCDPQSNEGEVTRSSRIWLNQFLQHEERDPTVPKTDGRLSELPEARLEGGHFSDIYRRLHPNQENAFTCWCTLTGARQTNYGRRLDYIFIDKVLAQYAKECDVMADVHGSDHCPVILNLNCESIPSSCSPALCSKLMPEFRGQQKKLSAFFSKMVNKNSESNLQQPDVLTSAVNSTSEKGFKTIPSPSKNNSSFLSTSTSPSSHPAVKRQSSSAKEQSQKKKIKLQKEDSKQTSLNFFYHSTAKSKNQQNQREMKTNPTGSKPKNDISTADTNESISVIDIKDSEVPAICVKEQIVPSDFNNASRISSSGSEKSVSKAWKNILGGLPPPPLCPGHKEPSVLRTVKKEGPNKNKQFYVCCRPDGAPGNPQSRCDFFQWLTKKK